MIRPATVCGYSPRQRLDVIVNILTNHACHNGRIKIMGGAQLRPNIHIDDMARVYLLALSLPDEKVDRPCRSECRAMKIIRLTAFGGRWYADVVGQQVAMESCRPMIRARTMSPSEAHQKAWGFVPVHSIEDASRMTL